MVAMTPVLVPLSTLSMAAIGRVSKRYSKYHLNNIRANFCLIRVTGVYIYEPCIKGSYNYAHGMTDIHSIGQHRFLVETELAFCLELASFNLLTYGILALFGVCNLRRVGTHVFVRCRVEVGFSVFEICEHISFIKNVLKGFSCFSFVS